MAVRRQINRYRTTPSGYDYDEVLKKARRFTEQLRNLRCDHTRELMGRYCGQRNSLQNRHSSRQKEQESINLTETAKDGEKYNKASLYKKYIQAKKAGINQ